MIACVGGCRRLHVVLTSYTVVKRVAVPVADRRFLEAGRGPVKGRVVYERNDHLGIFQTDTQNKTKTGPTFPHPTATGLERAPAPPPALPAALPPSNVSALEFYTVQHDLE